MSPLIIPAISIFGLSKVPGEVAGVFKVKPVGARGLVTSLVKLMAADVVELPAVSVIFAVKVCAPAAIAVESIVDVKCVPSHVPPVVVTFVPSTLIVTCLPFSEQSPFAA